MFAGVDACKGGWIVAKSASWPCKEVPWLAVCPDFRAVLALTQDCRRVAVDIPIGIPSGKQLRLCDQEAKKFLSTNDHNHAAVFFTPPRECLTAKDAKAFQLLHARARKTGAGYPVWGIVRKIKEADERMIPELQKTVIEFHPELAWLRNARKNLSSKHTTEGISERKNVLRLLVPGLERLLRWNDFLGRAAAADDILDALIGIGVARDSVRNSTYCLPANTAEFDSKGLRMEMWY
jgi:predicted RNase H-like nuclease